MADEITGLGITEQEMRKVAPLNTIGKVSKALREKAESRTVTVTNLGSFAVEGGDIKDKESGDAVWPLDDASRKSFGLYMNIPVPFLQRTPPDLAGTIINWGIKDFADKEARFTSEDGSLIAVENNDTLRIEELDVMDMLASVVGNDAVVRLMSKGLHETTIDVSHPKVSVEPKKRVGDVTEGGLRIVLPHKSLAPTVGSYFQRLVCSNGAVTTYPGAGITVRGKTYDEIVDEMYERVSTIWENTPTFLAAYAKLDEQKVDNARYMIRMFAEEHNLPERAVTLAIKYYDEFMAKPENAKKTWTYYDIMQLFTSLAHESTIKTNTAHRLQALGGHMVANALRESRCDKCSHLLKQ